MSHRTRCPIAVHDERRYTRRRKARFRGRLNRESRSMTRNILIVDDHPIFLDALALIISSAVDDIVLTQAHSLAAARACLAENKTFDLVLLDLWLPDTHGFEALIELRKERPKLPV